MSAQADDCFALPPGVDWTPVDVALARLREGLTCAVGATEGPLEPGSVLGEPVVARRDSPPADNSAVDGYAFAWESVAGGSEADLALAEGRAAAGHPWEGRLKAGQAVRILTGAAMPAGADTVVLQEDCRAEGGRVSFPRPRKAGANARLRAEDSRAGDTVLPAGRRLRPQDIALAASVGVTEGCMRERLTVGVLSTGDELAASLGEAGTHGVIDANRPMLTTLVARLGHTALDLDRAGDDSGAVRRALDKGAEQAGAIVTTGGASSGDEDHISRLLAEDGRMETWRIAVKPGRPMAMGLWRGVPVFGLPGNPVAAFVCALVFVRPALAVLAGEDWPEPQGFQVPAGFAKRKKPGRREYLRARIGADGRAEVFRSEGSGLIGGLAWADGLVELPDAGAEIAPGDPVRYLPYASFGL